MMTQTRPSLMDRLAPGSPAIPEAGRSCPAAAAATATGVFTTALARGQKMAHSHGLRARVHAARARLIDKVLKSSQAVDHRACPVGSVNANQPQSVRVTDIHDMNGA